MPISSLAQTQLVIQNLQQLQNQGQTLEQEITTGLTSQSFAGIAPQSAQLVDLSAQQSQDQGYVNTGNAVNTQLQTMSLATSTITTLVQQFNQSLATDAFNTQDGEGYVFSGSATSTPPYDASGLPNPGDLTTPVSGAPPAGYYAGNDTAPQAQIDANLNIPYGVTGDNPAFEQVIRVLNFLANSPTLSESNPTDVANVNTAQQLLTTATTQLQQLTATMGLQQSEISNVQQAQQSSIALSKSSIADIENANPATVITQLDALQTQMEASYQTVNILQNLSLASYMTG
jgi:flagellar hook-associated protein 3 FlgL